MPYCLAEGYKAKIIGGLGIFDLQNLNWAFRVRWLWLRKVDPDKPWAAFSLQVSKVVDKLFSIAVASVVGDGASTLFWRDSWLHGRNLGELAPSLFGSVPARIKNKRTVREALADSRWINDLRGMVTWQVIHEFLRLWDMLAVLNLQPRTADRHIWRLSSNGQHSAKSAYEALCSGGLSTLVLGSVLEIIVTTKCAFFLWLAAHDRCWTANRLEKRNLPHAPLCDHEKETINHLLVGCVFARQFWSVILQRVGLAVMAPQPTDQLFDTWWSKISDSVSSLVRRRLNSLIILGAWTLWRHRNDCVFKMPLLV